MMVVMCTVFSLFVMFLFKWKRVSFFGYVSSLRMVCVVCLEILLFKNVIEVNLVCFWRSFVYVWIFFLLNALSFKFIDVNLVASKFSLKIFIVFNVLILGCFVMVLFKFIFFNVDVKFIKVWFVILVVLISKFFVFSRILEYEAFLFNNGVNICFVCCWV